jgi:hypothetical protein
MSAFKAKAASQLRGAPCPLLAQSGRAGWRRGVKRTPTVRTVAVAFDPKLASIGVEEATDAMTSTTNKIAALLGTDSAATQTLLAEI